MRRRRGAAAPCPHHGVESSINCRRAHAVLCGDLRDRQIASVHKRAYRTPLAIIELLRPAALASTRAGGREAGAGALPDDRALQLGERRGDMEDERAHGCRRVDRLGERDEFDAAFAKLVDEGYQVFDGSAEAIETPDDERVAFAQ